jgi:predicted PurR-regulated permease PerM
LETRSAYLTGRIRGVVRLAAISLFLALTLMPLVDAVCARLPAPRALVILSVYALLIAIVAVTIVAVGKSTVSVAEATTIAPSVAPRSGMRSKNPTRKPSASASSGPAPSWSTALSGRSHHFG